MRDASRREKTSGSLESMRESIRLSSGYQGKLRIYRDDIRMKNSFEPEGKTLLSALRLLVFLSASGSWWLEPAKASNRFD
jgi:hypothetical protein